MSTTIELPITGMTCASCANRIERKLNKLDGVNASVNYATEKATVEYDPAAVEPDALVGAVEAAGYHATLPGRRTRGRERPTSSQSLRQRLIISAVLSLPVLLDVDDPGAAVRQLAVAGADRSPRPSSSGARGRSTAPRGRTCATARRRWTR